MECRRGWARTSTGGIPCAGRKPVVLLYPASRPGLRHSHHSDEGSGRLQVAALGGSGNTVMMKALEGTLIAIQKVLDREASKARKKKKEAQDSHGGGAVATAEILPSKLVTFKAGSSSDNLIKAAHLPGRSLRDYLGLPLDAYSMLDPRWISRDAGQPGLFHLTVPMQELVGLPLEPRISILVDIDAENQQVRFHADRFVLGSPKFDESFKLDLKAVLQNRAVPDVSALPSLEFWRSKLGMNRPEQTTEERTSVDNAAMEGNGAMAGGAAAVVKVIPSTMEVVEVVEVVPCTMQDGVIVMQEVEVAAHASVHHVETSGPDLGRPAELSEHERRVGDGHQQGPPVPHAHSEHAAPATDLGPPEEPGWCDEAAAPDVTSTIVSSSSSSSELVVAESAAEGGSRGVLVDSSALLWCKVDVEVEVQVPHPLSAAPRPLLNMAATLITKFTIQQLLPGFLKLLSVDYERWASGKMEARSKAAGSLLSNASSSSVGKAIDIRDEL